MREDTYDVLRIKNQLCFPLYACAREVIKQYKPFLDSLDLTYTQYITMMVLWEEKSLTVKELGDILYLDSGTLTPLLKKMETKGLITRKRSMQDERSLIVSITQKGDALKEKAVEVPAKLAQTLKLTPDECVQLHGLLNKMLD
ncbi:MAG: MarR family transcriptional regulator [Lachnospiraceae bacterium]|nr:MarR family transcriptional regulator [Lachnospiraceae bacterium]